MSKPEDFFAKRLKEMDEERDRIAKETFIKTRSMDAVNEALRSGRGGARPGSGRKLGSGHGRIACDRLQFNVTPEFRELFEELADREDLSRVKFLQKLLFEYRDRLREKGELD